MSVDMCIDAMMKLTSDPAHHEHFLKEIYKDEDGNIHSLQKSLDRTLRMNIISKDKVKASIVVSLLGKIRMKNQNPEISDPKNGMKVKFKTDEEFIAFLSNSIYSGIAEEMKRILNG